MKFSKTLAVKDRDTSVEVIIKVKTDGKLLTADESRREFNKILDSIAKALFDKYNFQDIKLE